MDCITLFVDSDQQFLEDNTESRAAGLSLGPTRVIQRIEGGFEEDLSQGRGQLFITREVDLCALKADT